MEARGEQFLKLEIAGHCSSSFLFFLYLRLDSEEPEGRPKGLD